MSRPAGDPAALAAGARGMSAAAGALRDVGGRLRGATSFVVVAGAWKGPASEAFLVDGAGQQATVGRAAAALDQAAGALAELSARLEHAQSTWDRAQRLAASAEVAPHGGVRSPANAVDPAAMLVGGQAARMAEAAEFEAAAARRAAAARFDQATTALRAAAPGARVAGTAGHGGHQPGGSRPGEGGHGGGAEGHGGLLERAVGRVLEAGAEVATATHHLVTAAEARVQAAVRLAGTADDPAVRSAAGRVAQAAGRPLIDGRVMGALPLAAPVMDFAASVSHGEPLPRAFTGALGGAIGADLGGRAGLAACGGEAAVTQGAGLFVCPALTVVGGALGAQAGKAAALHVYDKIAGPPEAAPAAPGPGAGAATPGSRPGSGSGS
ncbi:MAG TPA: hypothetical protein VL330_00895 [Actinomycetes bacterium]|nr:hypothetical protein [Actinomycetes bacterium]